MTQDYSLPIGTVLQGYSYAYRIESVLNQSSFAIIYKASTEVSYKQGGQPIRITLAVKEFFMRDFNGRSGATVTVNAGGGLYEACKSAFMRGARIHSKLRHPGIVCGAEAFEANNTFYYVMEYITGVNLDDYIRRRGALPELEALPLITQAGQALSFMHQHHTLHLDVKPSHLIFRPDGKLFLIDFSLSKQYTADGQPETDSTIGGGTPGYAPLEQLQNNDAGDFPVTIDVYALGATLHKMLTGSTLPEASSILNDGFPCHVLRAKGVSNYVIASIAQAMAPMRKARFQSVDEFLEALHPGISVPPPPEEEVTLPPQEGFAYEETRPMPVTPPAPPVP